MLTTSNTQPPTHPPAMNGKSKSQDHPNGVRRTNKDGQPLAPKSLRRKGRTLLRDCTKEELERIGLTK